MYCVAGVGVGLAAALMTRFALWAARRPAVQRLPWADRLDLLVVVVTLGVWLFADETVALYALPVCFGSLTFLWAIVAPLHRRAP